MNWPTSKMMHNPRSFICSRCSSRSCFICVTVPSFSSWCFSMGSTCTQHASHAHLISQQLHSPVLAADLHQQSAQYRSSCSTLFARLFFALIQDLLVGFPLTQPVLDPILLGVPRCPDLPASPSTQPASSLSRSSPAAWSLLLPARAFFTRPLVQYPLPSCPITCWLVQEKSFQTLPNWRRCIWVHAAPISNWTFIGICCVLQTFMESIGSWCLFEGLGGTEALLLLHFTQVFYFYFAALARFPAAWTGGWELLIHFL